MEGVVVYFDAEVKWEVNEQRDYVLSMHCILISTIIS
jgi:hypothetical protein